MAEKRSTPSQADIDRDDYNRELSGVQSGRVKRFFAAGGADHLATDKSNDASKLNALEILLLTDPYYRQMYEKLHERLQEVEDKITEALKHIHERIRLIQQQLQDMEGKAHHLPDGRVVFITADGKTAFTQDGVELSKEEFATIIRSKEAVDWETYQAKMESYIDALNKKERVEGYRDRIDPIKRKAQSGEVIPQDDLDDMLKDIEDILPEMENEKLKAKADLETEKSASYQPPALMAAHQSENASAIPDFTNNPVLKP